MTLLSQEKLFLSLGGTMGEKYPLEAVEEKWQQLWKEHGVFRTKDPQETKKKPFYVLEMFPYPSGTLHMGHARNYTIGDVLARYRLASGYEVLHPMGWDACGLPAENAALKHKIHPKVWTYENARVMKEQCEAMGFSHDWSREVFSCDPSYYIHEQRIFLSFLKAGLAYRKESYVNWDPEDCCVLANEQVIDGRGWRSGALVEKKLLNQWFLSITRYNEELLKDLETLHQWPEAVKIMQENWIGRSEGCLLSFELSPQGEGFSLDLEEKTFLKVFTTRPETLYGATFCAIPWDHPFFKRALQQAPSPKREILEQFYQKQQQHSTASYVQDCEEKEGVFTGLFVLHPLTQQPLPLYGANYVRMDYGSGAVMGCPSHDERDGDFARHYNIPFCPILTEDGVFFDSPGENYSLQAKEESWPLLNGLVEKEGFSIMVEALEKKGLGQRQVMYRLKDWGIGRQRYWGVPIPIIYCGSCGTVPVADKDLPVTLPEDVTFDEPGNPLDRHPTWKHTTCPSCGGKAQRETDTFDTFMESSWYFGRFCDPHNTQEPFSQEKAEAWLPVDNYVGGIEHAVLHLLYARFFTKALRDCGYWNLSEPFKGLFTQGMVCHKTYKNDEGKWLYPEEVERCGQQYQEITSGKPVVQGRSEKMSKSKNNVVGVSSMVKTYGADAVRLFLMSDTPPQKDFEWSDEGIQGSWRYVRRLWTLFYHLKNLLGPLMEEKNSQEWLPSFCHKAFSTEIIKDLDKKSLEESLSLSGDGFQYYGFFHESLQHITQCLEDYALNKAVAHLRQWSNFLEEKVQNLEAFDQKKGSSSCDIEALLWGSKAFLCALSPFMPHIAQEIACAFGLQGWLHEVSWPCYHDAFLKKDSLHMGVQINGKFKGNIKISPSFTQEEILNLLQQDKKFSSYFPYKRCIFIPGRMINLVI